MTAGRVSNLENPQLQHDCCVCILIMNAKCTVPAVFENLSVYPICPDNYLTANNIQLKQSKEWLMQFQ